MTVDPLGTVLVTGASSGIGAACAQELDRRGYTVFAGVRRMEDGTALVRAASARVRPLLLDVTESASIEQAVATLRAAVGAQGLRALVNNAGISVAGPLELLTPAELRRQFDVNVFGGAAVTQQCVPLLRQAQGRLVNISSIAGLATTPFLGAYCASKYALEAMSDAWRLELAPWDIAVSLIEPGAIQSRIWERSGSDAMQRMDRLTPEHYALYAQPFASMKRVVEQAAARAIPASVVADAVAHAVTSSRPRIRYLVGWDARLRAWMKWLLPERVQDRILMKVLGL